MNVQRVLGNTKGQSLVELALIITLLLALIFGITEFGRGWYYSNTLTNGARAGARYASEKKQTFLGDSTINYAFSQIAASIPATLQNTINTNGDGDTFINISAYDPSGNVRTPLSSVQKGDAVMVIVHYNFSPLSEAGGIIPVLSGSRKLTRKATMYYEGS